MPALVPDPVDGQCNGKDTEPKKDINILTYIDPLSLQFRSYGLYAWDQLIQGKQDPLQCRVLYYKITPFSILYIIYIRFSFQS